MQLAREGEFRGTSRYAILRRVGAGGSGIVYEAYDRERHTRVALKTLALADAEALYRFKREFRALADVSHPNLVALHELVAADGVLFFTMELIEGVDLLSYVWRGDREAINRALRAPREPTTVRAGARGLAIELGPNSAELGPSSGREHIVVDYEKLRGALSQLALGVSALHDAGLLHRDIKLSNVLVTREERIVLLDFGIATELYVGADRIDPTTLVGTPEYMAPEQGALEPLTTAADWYAVGVVLYKALTGRAPFVGAPLRVLLEKQRTEPLPPSALVRDVPRDLDELCMDLLRRRPEARPSGVEVLHRLGVTEARTGPALRRRSSSSLRVAAPFVPFVGRDDVMAELRDAFDRSQCGEPSAVLVEGPSGMGKTSTVRVFLEQIAQTEGALVLVGQCYERETVSYKAVDGVVDDLSRHLLQLSPRELATVLPPDAACLARLFPVLERVRGLSHAPPSSDVREGTSLRRRAVKALRLLLRNLAARQPVVVFVDDLQWGDRDSVYLLHEVLGGADAGPVLFIAAYRSDEADASAAVRAARTRWASRNKHVTVGPLPPEAGKELALQLLTCEGAAAERLAEHIAEEARGNPYLVAELVRFAQRQAELPPPEAVFLEAVLEERIAELAPAARAVLAAVALASAPLPSAVALRAAGLDPARGGPHLTTLKLAGLVRTAGGDTEPIDCMHESLRDAVVRGLTMDEVRRLHGQIADALEDAPEPVPERRFVHLRAAGRRSEAAEHALYAARRAAQSLSFEHAAQLFEAVLSLHVLDAEEEREVRVELGDALAASGRGAAAADAFLAAAKRVDEPRRSRLEQRAAEELLLSGYPYRAMELLRALPKEEELAARTPFRGVAERARRLLTRWAGPSRRQLVPGQAADELDLALAGAFGLWTEDAAAARSLSARSLVAAERLREPFRLCRARCLDAIFASIFGPLVGRGVDARLAEASAHAESSSLREAKVLVLASKGAVAYFHGDPRAAAEQLRAALEGYTQLDATSMEVLAPRGLARSMVRWEVDTFRWLYLSALVGLGELRAMEVEASRFYDEGEARADRYVTTSLRLGAPFWRWLSAGDTAGARHVLEVAGRVPSAGFEVHDLLFAQAEVDSHLYTGRGADAFAVTEALEARLARSRLDGLSPFGLEAAFGRGRAALAVATPLPAGDERDRLLALADTYGRRLAATSRGPLPRARGQILRAGVAVVRGATNETRAALDAARSESERGQLAALTAILDAAELTLSYAANAPSALSRTLGSLGVADAPRFGRLVAPGLFR